MNEVCALSGKGGGATINSYHVTALWIPHLSLLSAESHLITQQRYRDVSNQRVYVLNVNPDGRATSQEAGKPNVIVYSIVYTPEK
jgi:hypothetical protein